MSRIKNKKGYLHIRSRHPSHDQIKNQIEHPSACIRFGSQTETNHDIQLNLPRAIALSANKLEMKRIFAETTEHTPQYWESHENVQLPVLAKRAFRSRGVGMRKIDTQEQLTEFINSNRYRNSIGSNNPYYFEKYHNYTREYRLHISEFGCFYSCRKMLRNNVEENRWFRNDSNSVWITQYHYTNGVYHKGLLKSQFNQPDTWALIVEECEKCLDAIGLDIGAFDVIVARDGRFKILEVNSAPSFGELTAKMYIEELKKILNV